MRSFTFLLLILLGGLFTACTDTTFPAVEELEVSPFLEGGPQLFEVVDVTYSGSTNRTLTIEFSNFYNTLPEVQQQRIRSLEIVSANATYLVDPDATTFTDPARRRAGNERCYQFRFLSGEMDRSRNQQICVPG